MVLGLGIDTVDIPRFRSAVARHGARLIRRIAHSAELRGAPRGSTARAGGRTAAPHSARYVEYWAARFAAKEAFAKALGTGIGKTVRWKDVGVRKEPGGKPSLVFSRVLSDALRKRRVLKSHLAITHAGDYAMAVVILEGTDK